MPDGAAGRPVRRSSVLAVCAKIVYPTLCLCLSGVISAASDRPPAAGAKSGGRAESETSPAKPNIVYVLCDDLGYGDVHALNPERSKIATPNMDRLRAEGMAFTDCHSGSAVCTPSRYCLLTGRYCWRTHLQASVLWGESPPLISPDHLTVPELLKQQGYTTAVMGKWHLGLAFDPKDYTKPITDGPLQHGFDYFFGISGSLDMPPYDFIENDHFTEVPKATKMFASFIYGKVAEAGPTRPGPAAPDFEAVNVLPRVTAKAVDYITAHGADHQPFFLYLALPSPHSPLVPAKEWQGRSGLGPYGDYVMETDWSLGQVLQAIDRAGLRSGTLVMFASDNGCSPYIGVHKLEALGHFPSARFRGYKSDIWDGGHRIPYLVRWPGKIKPGSKSDQTVELTDLIATLADILGQPLPENAGPDSRSLLPALTGQARRPIHRLNVYHSIEGNFAIQEGRWKLELCPGSGGWDAPIDKDARAQGLPRVQLYDMVSDIGEKTNVEAAHPDIVARLTADLESCVASGRSTPGPAESNDVKVDLWKLPATPAEKAKLEKVGD